jgi:hypothetical protein
MFDMANTTQQCVGRTPPPVSIVERRKMRLRNVHGIISRSGRVWRDAMQGARRSHSELWRRRTTPQCARQTWNKSENYFVHVP